MGLIRSLARRALEKVTEKVAPPAAAPAATPPAAAPHVHAPPVVAAPPPAAHTAAAPAPAAQTAPAARPDTPEPPAKAARPRRALRPEDESVAAELATLSAGAQEIKERMEAGEPVVLLDVREPFETAGGVIPGATLLPLGQLGARWQELFGANEVVCYCASGVRSVQAARLLREKGVFNATSLEGGISEWMQIGGRIVRPG